MSFSQYYYTEAETGGKWFERDIGGSAVARGIKNLVKSTGITNLKKSETVNANNIKYLQQSNDAGSVSKFMDVVNKMNDKTLPYYIKNVYNMKLNGVIPKYPEAEFQGGNVYKTNHGGRIVAFKLNNKGQIINMFGADEKGNDLFRKNLGTSFMMAFQSDGKDIPVSDITKIEVGDLVTFRFSDGNKDFYVYKIETNPVNNKKYFYITKDIADRSNPAAKNALASGKPVSQDLVVAIKQKIGDSEVIVKDPSVDISKVEVGDLVIFKDIHSPHAASSRMIITKILTPNLPPNTPNSKYDFEGYMDGKDNTKITKLVGEDFIKILRKAAELLNVNTPKVKINTIKVGDLVEFKVGDVTELLYVFKIEPDPKSKTKKLFYVTKNKNERDDENATNAKPTPLSSDAVVSIKEKISDADVTITDEGKVNGKYVLIGGKEQADKIISDFDTYLVKADQKDDIVMVKKTIKPDTSTNSSMWGGARYAEKDNAANSVYVSYNSENENEAQIIFSNQGFLNRLLKAAVPIPNVFPSGYSKAKILNTIKWDK